ncbi:MAG: hypothetical protein ABSA83_07945 [Verrucomicrobiota bacterium]
MAKPVGGKNLVQQKCLMGQRLHCGLGESSIEVVFSNNQPSGKFAAECANFTPTPCRYVRQRVADNFNLVRRYILQAVEVIEGNLQSDLAKGVLLHVAHQPEAIFRVSAVNDPGVRSKGGRGHGLYSGRLGILSPRCVIPMCNNGMS